MSNVTSLKSGRCVILEYKSFGLCNIRAEIVIGV